MRPFGLALLGLLVASPARAVSFVDYRNTCAFYGTVTCASFQVFTSAIAAGTRVEIRVRNLEGTHPAAKTGTSFLNFVWWGADVPVDWSVTNPFLAYHYQNIGSVGGQSFPYDEGEPEVFGLLQYQIKPRLLGCTLPPGWDWAIEAGNQTCDSLGYTGWLSFGYDVNVAIEAADIWIQWSDACELRNGQVTGHLPGGTCRAVDPNSVTVTPEPRSWVLLALGLVAVGLAQRVRTGRRPA